MSLAKKRWGKRCKSDKLREIIRPEFFDVSQDEIITRNNSLKIKWWNVILEFPMVFVAGKFCIISTSKPEDLEIVSQHRFSAGPEIILKWSASRIMGSQHPSPNVKNLCNFEMQTWLEMITSRDAQSACFQGSQTSCTEIISGVSLPKFGRKRPHHVMDACCW